jgi:hypothetical protein
MAKETRTLDNYNKKIRTLNVEQGYDYGAFVIGPEVTA